MWILQNLEIKVSNSNENSQNQPALFSTWYTVAASGCTRKYQEIINDELADAQAVSGILLDRAR